MSPISRAARPVLQIESLEPRLLLAADWTVLVYMDGDNSLESYALANLNAMEQVGSNAHVNIVVELDRGGNDPSNGGWADTRRGRIIQDQDPNTISTPLASIGPQDMANPNTLANFLTWGASTFPAQHYAVILWDHGGGVYGLCEDDTSGTIMSIPQMGQAFARVGQHFDLIGFDACLMSMVEPAYEIRSFGDYMVASQEEEPGNGWDYTGFLTSLEANPGEATVSLAASIVSTYGAQYTSQETMATIDLRQMGASGVAGALDNFATTFMADANPNDISLLETYRELARPFGGYDDFRDVGGILQSVATDNTITGTIRTAAGTALLAYQRAVVNKYPADTTDATGLSIYFQWYQFPTTPQYLTSGMAFLKDTHWAQFLGYWFQGLQPGRLTGTVWNDLNGNGVQDPGEQPLSGWTVFADTNGNGQFDSPTQQQFASTDVPKFIPDVGTVTSTLNVAGLQGTVTNVTVTLNIQHTWDSDLTAYLISPAGERVALFDGVGDNGHNFTNTTFDDHAPASILTGAAPFVGRFKPQGYLSSLNGHDPNGQWTLEVTDNYFFDVGNILSWSIAVQYGDMYAVTDSTGAYNLSNLPPGPYAIYEVTQNQYYQTVPAQGAPYNVTLASGQTFSNLDFGNRLTVGRPMLLPATDSGRYSDDRITNFDNSSDSKKLMFRVPGTTPGATVTIYANGRAIGSAIAPADSTSTDVTTDGDYRLTPDGVFHIQANQTDAGGQTGLSVPLDITIDTTPPVMGVDSLRTADTSPPLSGTVDDPNATIVVIVNGHSYDAVNHGDGTWSLAGNTLFPPLVGGIYDVRAEGTDIAGNTGHDTTTGELILSVTISSVTGPAHTDEGTVVTFTCQAADPDGSTISYTWNFNDGTPPQTLIGVNTIQHAFPDDGAFTINVQATIPNGQMDRGSTSIAVANVAPTIRSLATQAEFLRGQQGQIVADVFDPGTQDSLTYAWDFGDGSDPVSGISLASPHHTYAEAGRYAVTLTVTDEDHGWDRLTQTFPVWSKVVTPTAGQPLDFMDCDLNHVHVTITGGGSAQAYFLADTAADLGRLVISNSTSRTVVNISSTGAATTSVGDVIVDRTVAAIIAPNVELTGTIRVPQRAPLIQFGNVESGAQINIGAVLSAQNIIPGDGVSLRLGSIQDLSIDTHHLPIRSLTAVQWLNTDDTPDSLQAAWIGALRMLGTPAAGTGDFQADVTLSGDNLPAGALAVGSVYIRGSLEDSTWQIAGPAASVTVGGNMTHAAIDITCDEDVAIALGRLSVTGLMSDSEVRSTGDIGSAVVGAMHDSRIFAGVAENVTGLPQPSPDIFLPGSQAGHAAQIGSVIVRGMAQQGQYYSFVNSSIAAYRVGNVVMTQADFFSQGAPFGVAAWQAGSISYTDRNPRLNWKWSGQASQVINTNANMTVRLGVNDLASFRPGELLGRGRIGNGGSTRTNLTSVYLRAVGDWVYIGIGTLRPLTYSGLRVRILLDTLNGTDHLLYANDRRSDMMVELNLDTSAISLYEGGFAVPDPTLPVPAWVDLWHPQRWMSLPTMSSSVVTTPNGLILRLPKAALGPLDHLSLTCASLWTAAGATVDTVYC